MFQTITTHLSPLVQYLQIYIRFQSHLSCFPHAIILNHTIQLLPLEEVPYPSTWILLTTVPLGIFSLEKKLMCRLNFNFNSEEGQSYVTQTAPMMSNQTSQQTVTQQLNLFDSTPTFKFLPTFDPTDDEMETNFPHDIDFGKSYHEYSSPHNADLTSIFPIVKTEQVELNL